MQRIVSRAFQLLACVALTLTMTSTVNAASADGTWTITTPAQGQRPERTSTLKLKTEGDKVMGTISGRQNSDDIKITDGKVSGDDVSFTVTREFNGNTMVQKYAGKVAGDTIKFKVTGKNRDGEETTREVEAKRKTEDKK
jgi:hypothetical protein